MRELECSHLAAAAVTDAVEERKRGKRKRERDSGDYRIECQLLLSHWLLHFNSSSARFSYSNGDGDGLSIRIRHSREHLLACLAPGSVPPVGVHWQWLILILLLASSSSSRATSLPSLLLLLLLLVPVRAKRVCPYAQTTTLNLAPASAAAASIDLRRVYVCVCVQPLAPIAPSKKTFPHTFTHSLTV